MPLDSSVDAADFIDFTLDAGFDDIPSDVIERGKDLILDLLAVGAAADTIPAARIGREIAVRQFNTGSENDRARIMFDGRTASSGGCSRPCNPAIPLDTPWRWACQNCDSASPSFI